MHRILSSTVVTAFTACSFCCGFAQRSTHTARSRAVRNQHSGVAALQQQMQQMHDDLQGQIDVLRQQLAQRDEEVTALREAGAQQASASTLAAAAANRKIDDTVLETERLQTQVQQHEHEQQLTLATVQRVSVQQQELRRDLDEPKSIHYKGVTLTPGGFLAAESIWRQRAMNADIYTDYNLTPYRNSGQSGTSEWIPSARQSRLSLLAIGKVPFGELSGYFEGDFLSAGTTSNNLQTNSYTLRVRQAWAQAKLSRTTVTGGEMWTLLTEDKAAAQPGQEALPLLFDGNLHVGFTYVRQAGFRVQQQVGHGVTLAAALENSQYQFSGSNAPSNFFFGNAGAAQGLNNSAASYTDQVAPDVIAKVSFDPGRGHYEIAGVARFFRDRYYPNPGSSAGAQNDTKLGGGFAVSARFPLQHKVDFGVHLTAGDGTGRYGASLLPDITVHPNGTLEPLRNAQGIISLEAHPTRKLDLFGYAGTEYVQRSFYRNAAGTLVGYAPPTASDTGCFVEAVPTAGTGYAPGTGTCIGATRDLLQGSAGWVYRFYSGPAGKLQYGIAYSYLARTAWSGVGGAPTSVNNLVYTSFRYYIP
jgi:hypothetical protein